VLGALVAMTPRDAGPRWREWMVLAVFAVATLLVTLHHEPWRDEAETWLVARDLPLADVLTWTRPAGTPFLWPALVLPFARSGAPYIAQSLLHWSLAVGAAALFVFFAPFALLTRILFLASFYPAYQYTAIARTYALGILLLFAVLALWPHRSRHPLLVGGLIALLPNANAHSAAPAVALMVLLLVERVRARARDWRAWAALGLMLLGLALAALQLKTSGHFVPPQVVSAPYWGAFSEALTGAWFPAIEHGASAVVAWTGLLLVLVALRHAPGALFFLISSLSGLAFIFTVLWIGGYRHYGLILIAIVAALWLGHGTLTNPRTSRALALVVHVSLALSIAHTARFFHADLTRNFSGSREMANVLLQEELRALPIAAHPPTHAEAVLPYLAQKTLWYAALRESGSHLRWDAALRVAQATSADRAAANAAQHFHGKPFLFLSAAPLADPQLHSLRLLYATREPLVNPRDAHGQPNDERYWLYRAIDAIPPP
jgi:hypothetical protein